jgi:hypothetical protein
MRTMRTILISTLCLFFHLGINAQSKLVVLHVTGQAEYLPFYGAKPLHLAPGDEIEIKGKIKCKGSGSVRLIFDGIPITVNGTKVREVEEIVRTATRHSQMSFTGRFFSFLNESVNEGITDEKLKKHHRRYMNKTSGGIKGFATPDVTVKAILLTTGKLPSANVIFKWRSLQGGGPYLFTIQNAAQKDVAKVLTRDTAITLDLDQLALNLDEEYLWMVERGEKDHSAQIPFEVCPSPAVDQHNDLTNEPTYQSASPEDKQLMTAFLLEEERFFYAANQIYQHLTQQSPDNAIYRRVYASFLARMDMLPEAEKMIATKQ